MNKFFKIMVVVVFGHIFGGIFAFVGLWNESPESVRILFGCTTPEELSSFEDNSKLIIFQGETPKESQPTESLPKVETPTLSLDELVVEAREKRNLEEEKFCSEESKIWSDELLRPREVTVNVSKFGGSWDRVVGPHERGSVAGNRLRSLNDKEDMYMAYPISGNHTGLPNIEEYFGKSLSGKGRRIEEANKSLNDYLAEISHTDTEGVTRTIRVRFEDRGPRRKDCVDLSFAACKGLGLVSVVNGDPDSSKNQVTLNIRLVPKPDSEPASDSSETITSSVGGVGSFELPSWNVASN